MGHLAISAVVFSLLLAFHATHQQPAESANDHLIEVLESAPLKETLTSTFEGMSPMAESTLADCAKSDSSCQEAYDDINNKKLLVLSRARNIDGIIKAGNKQRRLLIFGMDTLVTIWQKIEKISTRLNNILKFLDPTYLDGMRVKSASIGNEVRKGSSEAGAWPMSRIKSALEGVGATLKKIIDAQSAAFKGSIITTAMKTFTASQIYSAIHSSSLEGHLRTDPDVKDLRGTCEDVVKKTIRKAALKKYGAWVSGGEKANRYMEEANTLLNKVAEAVDRFNEIASQSSSTGMASVARVVSSKLIAAMEQQQICQDTINNYKTEIEDFYENSFRPFVRDDMMIQGIMATLAAVNDLISKVPEVGLASSLYRSYETQIFSADQEQTNKLLADIATQIDVTDSAIECYERATMLIGNVINKCRGHTGSFESIYQQASSEAAFDSNSCKTKADFSLSKSDVQGTLARAASSLGFNADCQGKRRDEVEDGEIDISEVEISPLSISEKVNICNLRKIKKPEAEIAQMLQLKKALIVQVSNAECKKIDEEKSLENSMF